MIPRFGDRSGPLIDHSGIHRINRRVDGCYSLGSFRRAALKLNTTQRGFNASFVAHQE
jgi:hypothetical protein